MQKRQYRRVDLFIPALLRDTVDRVGVLSSALWTVLLVLYVGWVLFALYFIANEVLRSSAPLGELFSEGTFEIVFATMLIGATAWSPGALVRLAGGALLFYLALAFLQDLARISWNLIATGPTGLVSWGSYAFLVAAVTLVTITSVQILLASIALVLFNREKLWRAFSNGTGDDDPGIGRLTYYLGLAHTGFYRGSPGKALMLGAKMLMMLGVLATSLGVALLYIALFGEEPKKVVVTKAVLWLITSWLLSGGLGCVALTTAIGYSFRRWFRPPQYERLDAFRDRPVFLRSYRDDNVRLGRHWSLSALPLPPDLPRNVDEMVLARLPDTVAFGRPDDIQAPFGVSRHYLRDTPWRDAVLELIERSSLLLITVDNTNGVDWEISQVLLAGHGAKAKFLMHPKLPTHEKRRLTDAFAITVGHRELALMRGLDVNQYGEVRVYLGPNSGAAYRCMLGWMLNR